MITIKGRKTTYEDLKKVKLTRPDRAGSYWRGLRHIDLVDAIIHEAGGRGWDIPKTEFALNADKTDMAAAFALADTGVKMPRGVTLEMGLLTSNALRRMTRLTVGGTVVVCHNGLITGEVVMEKKHSKNFDLEGEVKKAFDQFIIKAKEIKTEVDHMRDTYLSEGRVDELLIRTGREKIMPWSHVGMVDHLLCHPIHEEFRGNSLWSIMNTFTEVVKRTPPLHQMGRMQRFNTLLKSMSM